VYNKRFSSSKVCPTIVDYNCKKRDVCKEVTDMLSLEIIGVMGGLFVFLVYAMVRTQAARRVAQTEHKAEEHAARPAEETR
jgi:hypothetical protein